MTHNLYFVARINKLWTISKKRGAGKRHIVELEAGTLYLSNEHNIYPQDDRPLCGIDTTEGDYLLSKSLTTRVTCKNCLRIVSQYGKLKRGN